MKNFNLIHFAKRAARSLLPVFFAFISIIAFANPRPQGNVAITSFSPQKAGGGITVTINGSGFTNVSSVKFGNSAAMRFTIVSDVQINAVVGYSGASGNVTLETGAEVVSMPGFTYLNTKVKSFTPNQGKAGDHIIIGGTDLDDITAVRFGGQNAASFQVLSSTQIEVVLGSGKPGTVAIQSPFSYDSTGGFNFLVPPAIRTFSPSRAQPGELVRIYGEGFTNTTAVTFGGVPAKSFTILAPGQINAYVDNGASGFVKVTATDGVDSAGGFVYGPPNPAIERFTPTSAQMHDVVSIFGSDFINVQQVYFGGMPAKSFTVNSSSLISAQVDSGKSGPITVQTATKTVSMDGFVYSGPFTTIESFSPVKASPGNTVQISGTNFETVSEVSFGGVKARSFQVISPTQINAIVDTGKSGDVTIRSNYNTATLSGFTFQPPPPSISGISPYVAKIGDPIVITGSNLTGATAITFGGQPAASFQVNSDTQITAILGDGNDGDVVVITPGGQATFSNFMFSSPPPKITSVSSLSGGKGTIITIKGDYFNRVNQVTFGGTYAAGFQIISRNEIQAQVDYGATGYVAVFSPLGIDSVPGFVYGATTPTIAWTDPVSSVTEDDELKISGDNVGYATSVTIGGVPVKSIKVFSSGLIHVFVAAGTPGPSDLVITTPNGTVKAELIFYAPTPQIYSFSPLTGSVGTVITVKGKYFNYANYVDFLSDGTPDLIPTSSFTIVSDSVLKAVIDTGCTGMLGIGNNRRSYGWAATLFDYKDPMQPAVAPSGSNPVTGAINTKITVDSSVQDYNGNPYVQRHYDIEPENNPSTATAFVTLYFFQYEFDNYNLAPNHGADLPTGPADVANKANLRIYQYHGFSATSMPGTYDGVGIEINPDDDNITWNAAKQLWEVSFNVTGFSGFFVASAGTGILPLKLLSFTAQQRESSVTLNWKTTDEKNTDHFEVLKSSDGVTFNRIAIVNSLAQPGENVYSYNDPAGYFTTSYYRLKMVDKDGKSSLSNVINVFGKSDNILVIYPNPAKGKVTVVHPEAKANTQIKLMDQSGRSVKIVKAEKGSVQTIINLQGATAGSYKIVLTDGRQTIVKSLLIE